MPSSSPAPPGAGTLPLALAYVQYLNCTHRHDGDSCGECPNCRQIAELAHPDLHFVYPVNKQGKKSGESVLSTDFIEQWARYRRRHRRILPRTGVVRPPRPGKDAQGGDLGKGDRRDNTQALVQELRGGMYQDRNHLAARSHERGGRKQDTQDPRGAVGQDALPSGERTPRPPAAHDTVAYAGGGRTAPHLRRARKGHKRRRRA